MAFGGLIKYTGFTFTQRKGIGRITAKVFAVLANGHFAMVAIVRMCVQGSLTGSAWETNALHKLASESLLGRDALVAALGFWDLLEFARNGSEKMSEVLDCSTP